MIEISQKTLSSETISNYLFNISDSLIPPLSSRVNINKYSEKIFSNAIQFWAFSEKTPVGFMACYLNDSEQRTGFVTHLSVLNGQQGKLIGARFLKELIIFSTKKGYRQICLEVYSLNIRAINFYLKNGFEIRSIKNEWLRMLLVLQ